MWLEKLNRILGKPEKQKTKCRAVKRKFILTFECIVPKITSKMGITPANDYLNILLRATGSFLRCPCNIWRGLHIIKLSLYSLHKSPVTSSLLGPNIFHTTLFSKTLSNCFSLNVTQQASHPLNVLSRSEALPFRNMFSSYGEGLLAPRQTPKLKDHPLSTVRDSSFNIFGAILHSSFPSDT